MERFGFLTERIAPPGPAGPGRRGGAPGGGGAGRGRGAALEDVYLELEEDKGHG